MKKSFIKVLSVLLVVTILATSLPFSALATEENTESNQTISTDMGDMSMTATNSFGEMLTESLSEQTNEQNNGYYISDIEYEGYCALVTFVTQQDCTIRVAVYEEDTGRMVTTASADVLATDTEAIVEFEDELPDYFVLKAFMLDENVAPLCKAYTCNEMTKMYEDFMATTTEDFPEDKVINLDESEDNNFLVMSDDTTTVTTDDETNVLISYDAETGVYTFGNIDNQIKSLKKDDIFYFKNGNVEELTFIKVGAIEINGTTAEITEAETAIEEVFDVVKIDNQLESTDFEVDEDYELEDGVVYEGSEYVEIPNEKVSTFALKDEIPITKQDNYTLTTTMKPEQPKKIGKQGSLTGSFTITGSAGFSVDGVFKYYLSLKFSEVEFTLTPSFYLNVTINGVGRVEFELKPLTLYNNLGFIVNIKPKFIAEANVEITINTTLKFTVGFGFDTKNGFVNKTTEPSFHPQFKMEGSLYLAFDLQPYAYFLSEKLIKVEMNCELGGKITAVIDSDNGETHTCNACIDGTINLVGDIKIKLVLEGGKEYPFNIFDFKIHITDFYYSLTYDEFGWGSCPYVNGNMGSGEDSGSDSGDGTGGSDGETSEDVYDCNKMGCDYLITIMKEATCTEDGYKQYLCKYCGDKFYAVIFSGHNFQNGNCIVCSILGGVCGENLTWTFDESTGTLTISGTGAMSDYSSHNRPWESYEDSIKTVVIEDGVTTIGEYAFYSFSSLTSITIPDSIIDIGSYAFCNCSSLADTKLPAGIVRVEEYTFSGCSSLSNVSIPNGVTYVGVRAFADCGNLSNITIPADVITIDKFAFEYCGLTKINYTGTIDQWVGIDIIPGYSNPFGNECNLYINDQMITEVNITCATDIKPYVFSHFKNIEKVVLGDTVETIGRLSFYGCSSLEEITLGSGLKSIGYFAFDECSNLVKTNYTGTINQWVEVVFETYYGGYAEVTNPVGISNCLYINNEIVTDAKITTATQINDYAFINCTSLESVIIGDSVTSIGSAAFYNCEGLTSITIPDGVTSIGSDAFYNCESLTSITIPDGVTSIGDYTFSLCGSLTSITIPDSVTEIGNFAFYTCTSLANITIPDGVTSIGSDAFNSCTSLTSIIIPNDVTSIGDGTFCYCTSLTSVTIPDSVTSIGSGAFKDCTSLTNITIPDGVTSIGSNAFDECKSLTNITIPDSVTSIGDYTFRGCKSLTSITIPDGVTSIGDYTFSGCTSLTSVSSPDSVTSIGKGAFNSCTSLTSITIPDGITSIGSYAFYNCTSLTDVYYSGTEEQWNEIEIGSNNGKLYGSTIHYNSTGVTYSLRSSQVDLLSFASTNSTETDVYTATAQNTVQNNEYIILVLKKSADINNFTDEDILYIDQKTAEADEITFNYVPKADDECIVYIIGLFSDSDSVKQEQVTPDMNDTIIGDVNEDGKVNTLDRVILTRYIAKWEEYPAGSINTVAADVNCDGKVNTLDRVILTRYIAKWEGYEKLPYTA